MHLDFIHGWDAEKASRAVSLCKTFLEAPIERRFIFGRNVYASSVLEKIDVAGVVDDFSNTDEFHGTPIVKLTDVPIDAVVLACSGGRPLTVRRLLTERGIVNLDYFMFLEWSGIELREIVFNEGFAEIASNHAGDLDWVFSLMSDETSRNTLRKLIRFRFSNDLDALEGFTYREEMQYFEPFIDYSSEKAVFVDVGGYDGFTSKEFIKHVPNYQAVHILEPEIRNSEVCREALNGFENITVHPYGAGSQASKFRFSSSGSASAISEEGDVEIEVRRIDDLVGDTPTFIKMDIEGAELGALEGARDIITQNGPTLAICVYHRPSDFWEIPRKVLSMYSGYDVYLRHYTESIYETVMFFVPKKTEEVLGPVDNQDSHQV